MDVDLALGLAGLALLDSLNTSTLFMVMVVLLMARRPVATSCGYLVGAAVSFFGIAVGLYFGASAAEHAVADAARWIRRGVFALVALWLFWLAFKRLRDRPRKSFALPAWFGAWSAVPVGAAATIADLPNAFPLLIAIERMVSNQVTAPTAVLAFYTLIYALPIAATIAVGVIKGEAAREVMRRVTNRFLAGTAKRSIPLTATFALLGAASVTLAVAI